MSNNVTFQDTDLATPPNATVVETIDQAPGQRQVVSLGSIGNAAGNTALTAGQKTMANSIPVVIASDQSAFSITGTVNTSAAQSGAWTVTANAGTNLNTSALALESGGNLATIAGAVIAQEATTSGVKGVTAFGAVTTNAPSYTTAKSDALSLDTSGLLRVSLKDTPANTNKFLVTADPITFASAQAVTQSGNWTARVVGNGGATLDAAVGAATAPTNMLAVGGLYNSTAPTPSTGQSLAIQLDAAGNQRVTPGIVSSTLSAWTSATALNATQTVMTNSGVPAVLVQLDQTTTITAGAITFEGTYDGINWVSVPAASICDPSTFNAISNPYTLQASTNKAFLLQPNGEQQLRIRLSTQITGTGSVTPYVALLPVDPAPSVSAVFQSSAPTLSNGQSASLQLDSAANLLVNLKTALPTGANVIGALTANQSVNVAQFGGTNAVTGTGAGGAGIPRVTVSNDSNVLATQSGTWTVQPGNTANTTAWLVSQTPATSGGCSTYRLLSAATTNGNNIKASAGQVYGFIITNTNASARFVKLYNKATAPTVGTDTPTQTFVIPGNANGSGMVAAEFTSGIAFGTGIGIGITGAVTDADTTAVAANEVVVNLFYK